MTRMKRIIVHEKEYDIAILPIIYSSDISHYCVYVILGDWNRDEDPEMVLTNCTYYDKGVYGVDTNHLFNQAMTLDEKKKDAIRQIKELIESFIK